MDEQKAKVSRDIICADNNCIYGGQQMPFYIVETNYYNPSVQIEQKKQLLPSRAQIYMNPYVLQISPHQTQSYK